MAVNREARARIALERRERTRRRLLDAARELIEMKGPQAATIDDIVRHAGISRGSFYNYFRSPAEVVRELGAERAERLDRRIAGLTEGVDDPALQLALMGQALLVDTMTDSTRAWVNLQMDRNDQPSQPVTVGRMAEIFARGVATGRFVEVDPAAARSLAFGAMRVAMRDIGLGLAPTDHGAKVQALILAALGVPHAEAQALCEESRRRVAAQAGQRRRARVRPPSGP